MSENFMSELLQEAQLVGGETYLETQPESAYAAYGESIAAAGSDYNNELRRHEIVLELFELMDNPDPEAHIRLQETLDRRGLPWRKSPRVIELSLRLFMTQYQFEFLSRR